MSIPTRYETRDTNGNIIEEKWVLDGQLHRFDGPAFVSYNAEGQIMIDSWVKHGKLHRLDGPARSYYDANKLVTSELWCTEGMVHRIDGPAYLNRLDLDTFNELKKLYAIDSYTISEDSIRSAFGLSENQKIPEKFSHAQQVAFKCLSGK